MTADIDATRLRSRTPNITGVEAVDELDRPPPPISSGIICLCVVAGHHQRSADPHQLARALGFDPGAPITQSQLLLAAKELGLNPT
jgi:hypothetical protein